MMKGMKFIVLAFILSMIAGQAYAVCTGTSGCMGCTTLGGTGPGGVPYTYCGTGCWTNPNQNWWEYVECSGCGCGRATPTSPCACG